MDDELYEIDNSPIPKKVTLGDYYKLMQLKDEKIKQATRLIKNILIQACRTTFDKEHGIVDIWHKAMSAYEDAFQFLGWEDFHVFTEEERKEWRED